MTFSNEEPGDKTSDALLLWPSQSLWSSSSSPNKVLDPLLDDDDGLLMSLTADLLLEEAGGKSSSEGQCVDTSTSPSTPREWWQQHTFFPPPPPGGEEDTTWQQRQKKLLISDNKNHQMLVPRGRPALFSMYPMMDRLTARQRFFEARGPKPLLLLLALLDREQSLSYPMLTALLLHFLPSITQRTQKKTGRLNGMALNRLFYDATGLTQLGHLMTETITVLESYPGLACYGRKLRGVLTGSPSVSAGNVIVETMKAFLKTPFKVQVCILSKLVIYIKPIWRTVLGWCCSTPNEKDVEGLNLEEVTHWGYTCGGCEGQHTYGPRFRCETCGVLQQAEFNLCGPCYLSKYEFHYASHTFRCFFRDVHGIANN